MKMIIYCDCCGLLLPNAIQRGECCHTCKTEPRKQIRKGLSVSFSRRPSPERILAAIRETVAVQG